MLPAYTIFGVNQMFSTCTTKSFRAGGATDSRSGGGPIPSGGVNSTSYSGLWIERSWRAEKNTLFSIDTKNYLYMFIKNLLAGLGVLLFFIPASAQTDCQAYLPTEQGTEWELTNYNKKGKETGKIVYKLLEKNVSIEGVTFTVESTSFDKKGEETFTNTFEAYCREGQFSFDMAFQLSGEMMQSYQNIEMEMDASDFELPTMDTPAGTRRFGR